MLYHFLYHVTLCGEDALLGKGKAGRVTLISLSLPLFAFIWFYMSFSSHSSSCLLLSYLPISPHSFSSSFLPFPFSSSYPFLSPFFFLPSFAFIYLSPLIPFLIYSNPSSLSSLLFFFTSFPISLSLLFLCPLLLLSIFLLPIPLLIYSYLSFLFFSRSLPPFLSPFLFFSPSFASIYLSSSTSNILSRVGAGVESASWNSHQFDTVIPVISHDSACDLKIWIFVLLHRY